MGLRSPKALSFVTIYCKGNPEPFRVHKNVITHYSPFFSKAFNSNFIEGKTQSITFDDVEAPIFGFFSNWLYTQNIETEDGKGLQLIEYAKLWSLAQRFMVDNLPDTLIQLMIESKIDSEPNSGSSLQDLQHYAYVVASPQEDSPLKKMVVEKTIQAIHATNMEDLMKDFPEGMLIDFCKALVGGCTKLRGWGNGMGFQGVMKFMTAPNPNIRGRPRGAVVLNINNYSDDEG